MARARRLCQGMRLLRAGSASGHDAHRRSTARSHVLKPCRPYPADGRIRLPGHLVNTGAAGRVALDLCQTCCDDDEYIHANRHSIRGVAWK